MNYRFEDAKKKIEQKYDEIEKTLIDEFSRAQIANDLSMMKEIASILLHFKGYSQCMDVFIEQSQAVKPCSMLFEYRERESRNNESFVLEQGAPTGRDIFQEVIPLCEKNFKISEAVFNNPEQINAKFVLNIYHLKLQVRRSSEDWLRMNYDI